MLDLRPFDEEILYRTVYGEARNQNQIGMAAVAFTIINRFLANKWYSGKSIAETCLMPFQYSSWNSGNLFAVNRKALINVGDSDPAYTLVRQAVNGALQGLIDEKTLTNGATHYYDKSMENNPPDWTKGATLVGGFGSFYLYKDVA